MDVKLEAPPVLMVLRCLYKDAQRASLLAQEVMAKHPLTYEQVQDLLECLRQKDLIANIEKNRSNGEAVYKLTRMGEKLLEERIPLKYHKVHKGREPLAC
jgi:predicted transcriptional regulator